MGVGRGSSNLDWISQRAQAGVGGRQAGAEDEEEREAGLGVPRHPSPPAGSGTDQERKRRGEACEGEGAGKAGRGSLGTVSSGFSMEPTGLII